MPDNDYPPNPPPNWPPQSPPPAWPPPPGGYYAPLPPGGYYAPLPPQGPAVNAPLILVFGILGIVLALGCGLGGIFGTVAWIMGNGALATLDQVGDPLAQRGMVVGGRICGMVATGIMALSILAGIVLVAFALLAPSSQGR